MKSTFLPKWLNRAVLILWLIGSLHIGTANAEGKGPINWGIVASLPSIDPHSTNGELTHMVLRHIYDALLRFDKKGDLVPALASSWWSEDPKTIIFKIRSDAYFHDGRILEPNDIINSIYRAIGAGDAYAMQLANVQRVEKRGRDLVVFSLKEPDPGFPAKLVDILIVRECGGCIDIHHPGDKSVVSIIGTGAYRISHLSLVPGILLLTAHSDWWDDISNSLRPIEINIRFFREDSTLVEQVQAGKIDFVFEPSREALIAAGDNLSLRVFHAPSNRTILLGLNQKAVLDSRSLLKIENVRHAIRASIRVPTVEVLPVFGEIHHNKAGTIVARGIKGWRPDLDVVDAPDIERAKGLLREAGITPSVVNLDCPQNRYRISKTLCEAVVAGLNDIGFMARLESLEFTEFLKKVGSRESHLYVIGWGVPTLDSSYMLTGMVRTPRPYGGKFKGSTGRFNATEHSDTALDSAIDAAETEVDSERRSALLQDALRIVKDRAIYIPLLHLTTVWLARSDLNVAPRLDARPDLARAIVAREH